MNKKEIKISTSYFARTHYLKNKKSYSVANSTPKGLEMESLPMFTPDWDRLVKPYKSNLISEEDYTRIYTEQLNSVPKEHINKILDEISKYDEVVLFCWEGSDKFCHRHILLNFLSEFNNDDYIIVNNGEVK